MNGNGDVVEALDDVAQIWQRGLDHEDGDYCRAWDKAGIRLGRVLP